MKFSYQQTARVTPEEITRFSEQLKPYAEHLTEVVRVGGYDAPESSINLPTDNELLTNVKAMVAKKVTSKLKYIVDIGIGGSNLGTKAIYDALYGHFDTIEPSRGPKMIFLDTNNPVFLSKFKKFITSNITSPEEILVNIISKSGSTTETMANAEITLEVLLSRFPDALSRVVLTTDHGSKLYELGQLKAIDTLTLPKTVGGRYSVLSAVGLFPLMACGIDVEALRNGAEAMRSVCTATDSTNNPALLSAIILFVRSHKGNVINDNFFYQPELESVGKWYRQLMGESIGKEHNVEGASVFAGMTPTVSIGSVDLHSVAQLYFGGPRDKVTTFVTVTNQPEDATVPTELTLPIVDLIKGKNASTIMDAIYRGVTITYEKQGLPFMEVQLDTVNAYSLGEFLQFKMIEMMYLGKLWNINTFDQPHVELYKVETKKILEG